MKCLERIRRSHPSLNGSVRIIGIELLTAGVVQGVFTNPQGQGRIDQPTLIGVFQCQSRSSSLIAITRIRQALPGGISLDELLNPAHIDKATELPILI